MTTSPRNPGTTTEPGNRAKETAKSVSDGARDTAGKLAKDAKDVARSAAETAKTEAQTRAEDAKYGVAREVSNVSSALRKAAEASREGSPQERTFGQIAEGLADVSDTIANKDLGEMARDVTDLARRNPLIFLTGAALVGFAATRFGKASAQPQSTQPLTAQPQTATTSASGYPATSITGPKGEYTATGGLS